MTNEKYKKLLQKERASKSSFMSSTKWRNLFSLLINIVETKEYGYSSKVKFLLDDTIRGFGIPKETAYINGRHLEQYFGTFELKEIEWIFFPNNTIYTRKNRDEFLKPKIEHHNIDELVLVLENSGKQFEYEVLEDGLKIYGYK